MPEERNPARIMRAYIEQPGVREWLARVHGVGPDFEVDEAAFEEWARYCDEPVDVGANMIPVTCIMPSGERSRATLVATYRDPEGRGGGRFAELEFDVAPALLPGDALTIKEEPCIVASDWEVRVLEVEDKGGVTRVLTGPREPGL